MDIIERLQELITSEGLTVSGFAKKLGVVDQTIRGIVIQKRNKPSFDLLVKIIQTFDWINAEWLLTGNGEMRKSGRTTSSPDLFELIQYLREKDEKIEKLIEEKTELKIKFDIASQKLKMTEKTDYNKRSAQTENPTGTKTSKK